VASTREIRVSEIGLFLLFQISLLLLVCSRDV
jgi:hypothetical protein